MATFGSGGEGGGGGEKAEEEPLFAFFATPNKDVPVPDGVAKAIWDTADTNDITVLTPLCEQWAGNTQAIDWLSPDLVSLMNRMHVFTSTRA